MNQNAEPAKIIENSLKNKEFKNALSLCKKYSSSLGEKDFYYLTSVCYRYLNESKKALINLDKLIQIDPNYGRAYQEIGHTNVLLKDKNKALKAYLRAVRHNPSLQSSWLGILSLENKNEELIKFVEQNVIYLKNLPPEFSHYATLQLLKLNLFTGNNFNDPILHQHLFGFDFSNPLGLAAGFDKNAEVIKPLLNLGFGFIEAGTVTPKYQFGNEKPRVFRLKEDKAIINHLGFNNQGTTFVKKKLKKLNLSSLSKGIVGINIGKNKETLNDIDDYIYCLQELGPFAHYVTVNISSPNTPGLRELQNRGRIEKLVQTLQKKQEEMNSLENTPIFFKIAPDIDEEQIRDIALISLANNIDGLVISNSTIERSDTLKSNLNNEIGGLSGKPLFLKSTMILRKMYTLTNGQIPLIGVGGINNALECYEKIKSGASLVQLYSALTFDGPKIINKILIDLSNLLKTDGYKSIKEAIGKET